MSFIGSLDQGTSSTRFMIFDHETQVIAQHQMEHRQILPHPGWVEHDAAEIWSNTQEVITVALEKAGLKGTDLAAIGIANQRETALFWDAATGDPLGNAIVWQDTRTSDYLNTFSAESEAMLQDKTGLTKAPYFSASKFHWMIENRADVQSAIAKGSARAGTIDSWLLWNIAGGVSSDIHLTDVTNASRTLLMSLAGLEWDAELLELFRIPEGVLPQIRSSSEVFAKTDIGGPLKAAIPIAGILGDQQAAMVGQACFDKGESKTTYGTGNFALLNTGTDPVRSHNGLLTTVLFKMGKQPAFFALEGSVAVTGSAIQWLRDQLGIIASASDIEVLAREVEDNGGIYFVPAFSGLFAPHWRQDARGAILGLTRSATKSHLARATLEAISYQTKEILDAMSADSGVALTQMKVDGGITASSLCMQIQSDILGYDIVRSQIQETTALGAAYAAGLAVGFWSGFDEIRALWRSSGTWSPRISLEDRERGFAGWNKAVEKSLGWAN